MAPMERRSWLKRSVQIAGPQSFKVERDDRLMSFLGNNHVLFSQKTIQANDLVVYERRAFFTFD